MILKQKIVNLVVNSFAVVEELLLMEEVYGVLIMTLLGM